MVVNCRLVLGHSVHLATSWGICVPCRVDHYSYFNYKVECYFGITRFGLGLTVLFLVSTVFPLVLFTSVASLGPIGNLIVATVVTVTV